MTLLLPNILLIFHPLPIIINPLLHMLIFLNLRELEYREISIYIVVSLTCE